MNEQICVCKFTSSVRTLRLLPCLLFYSLVHSKPLFLPVQSPEIDFSLGVKSVDDFRCVLTNNGLAAF